MRLSFSVILMSLLSLLQPWSARADALEDKIRAEIRMKRIHFELEMLEMNTQRVMGVIGTAERSHQEASRSSLCYEMGAVAFLVPSTSGTTMSEDTLPG